MASSFRLPSDLKEQLRNRAFIERRSQNEIVIEAVEAYLRLDLTSAEAGSERKGEKAPQGRRR